MTYSAFDYESPMLGRPAELAVLSRMLQSVADGAGKAALIEGEAGIGKSRLLAEVTLDADQRGFHVLRGGADEFDSDRPFAALGEALGLTPDATDPDQAELGRLLTAGNSYPGTSADRTSDPAFRIVDGILSLLERRLARGPVLLALDDVHWADLSTLRALHSIGRRLGPAPLALLLSLRPLPRSAELHRVIEDLAGTGLRIALRGLDDEAVVGITARLAGAPPGPRLRAEVGRALGNPLFIGALIGSLRDECSLAVVDGQVEVVEGRPPPTLRLTILRRLRLLSEPTLDLLRLASILGHSFSVASLSAVVGRSAIELLPSLDEAMAAGVLGEAGDHLTFRHDLIRDAVYDDLSPAVRKALHRDAGRKLAETGAPLSAVAAQMVLGAGPGDAEAVEWLRRAAREAALRSPRVAVELLERALALLPDDGAERDSMVVEIAPSLMQVGRGAEAVDLARRCLERGPSPSVEIGLRRVAGEAFWAGGRLAAAASELEVAAAIDGAPGDERLGCLALAANARFFLGDPDGARHLAEQARADGERSDDQFAVCLALQTLALVADAKGFVGHAVELAERAVALSAGLRHPRRGYLYPHLYLGLVLIDADRLEDASATLQEGRRRAEERGGTRWLPLYHLALGAAANHSGAWDDAVAESEAGLALADDVGTRLHAPILHGVVARVAIEQGDLVAAESSLEASRAEFVALADDRWREAEARGGLAAAGPQWPVEFGQWIRGLLYEAKGDLARASAAHGHAWELARPLRYFLSARAFGPDVVRVALIVGDRDRAETVTEELELGARRASVPTAEGAALLCRGQLAGDIDLLLAAIDAYNRGPRPADGARAREVAAAALVAASRANEAITMLEEARTTYQQLGAVPALARSEAALRALGVRRRRATTPRPATVGWESLTKSESQVVHLVVGGLTNRQVGERLFVSRRTVETHLMHVFQKLGFSTRVQLAAEAARRIV